MTIIPERAAPVRPPLKKFLIRRYQLEDVAGIYAATDETREELGRWMNWMTPGYALKDTQTWVAYNLAAWERGDEYQHVIVDAADQSIVGGCGLNVLSRIDLVYNLGYWVRASRWGEGAARQATLLLREFGFKTIGLNRLEILVAVGNSHSQQVAESVGARYEGVQAMRIKVRDRVQDAHMYALINEALARASVPA